MKRLFELINKNILKEFFSEKTHLIPTEKELPIITISREMGSGGRPIANLVVKTLGKPWKLFHREIIEEISKESQMEKKLIKEVDENKIPLIDELVADFFVKRYLNLSNYYKNLVKVLSTVGHRGYVIIMGRGAQYLFPQALNVRIICETDQRIKWLIEYEKIIDFEKAIYGHDPRKAHHYDLVIRTGPEISIEDAADIIVFAARKKF